MDIPATAGPWIALGALAGITIVVLIALVAALLRRTGRASRPEGSTSAEPPSGPVEDDLAAFREFPPGFPGAPGEPPAPTHWPALAAVAAPMVSPAVPEPAPVAPGSRAPSRRMLVGLSAAAVVLVVATAATAAAAGRRPAPDPVAATPGTTPRTTAPSTPAPRATVPAATAPAVPRPGDLAFASVPLGAAGRLATLSFSGLVLERHAVGVTVTYPTVSVTTAGEDGGAALAHVLLPTYNCLGPAAPVDPGAAGCVRTVTEYADLAAPDLTVTTEDGGLRISGRFPTYVRPNGTPPTWTGRVYPLTVTARPLAERGDGHGDDGGDGRRAVPATAVVHLGTDRAESLPDAGLAVLR